MASKAATVEDYIAELPDDRKQIITKLRNVIKKIYQKGLRKVWLTE